MCWTRETGAIPAALAGSQDEATRGPRWADEAKRPEERDVELRAAAVANLRTREW
jgi:hypothetical protein